MSDLGRELVGERPAQEEEEDCSLSPHRGVEPQTVQQQVVTNLLAGLTTSFAAIALGAAFGVASGRGALVGILSAGTIALVTAVLGGTRVQCSGPTAPMTTVTTLFVAYSRQELLAPGTLSEAGWSELGHHPDNCTDPSGAYTPSTCPLPDYFCNIVMLMGAIFIALMGVCRVGPLISHVPNVVISGFMNGIAVQIWQKQIALLIGVKAMKGSALLNWPVTFATTGLCFMLPRITLFLLPPKVAKSMPGTLIAIALMTCVCIPLDDCLIGDYPDDSISCIEKTELGATISSFSDVSKLVSTQLPVSSLWTSELVMLALPFALQLAVLCYLDTLLTSLVVDKLIQERDKSEEVTNKGQELMAQGLANAIVALFGGLPGAQATIRSVLILKEGGTMRLAGIAAGVFVMIEMLIFQKFVTLIPQAVFCGVLVKVGYDVFDFEPFIIYIKRAVEGHVDKRRATDVLKKKYLGALADQEYDSTWEDVWADNLDRRGQSAYKSRDHLNEKVARYGSVLNLRGIYVNTWDDEERSRLEEEVREQHRLREAARSQTARRMKELRRSVKEIGVAVSDTLVDETKDLPSVGHLEMFLIMGTTTVTVAVNLNYAVMSFTLIFHALKRRYGDRVRDLSSEESKHAAGQTDDYAWTAMQLADHSGFSTAGTSAAPLGAADGGGDAYWG